LKSKAIVRQVGDGGEGFWQVSICPPGDPQMTGYGNKFGRKKEQAIAALLAVLARGVACGGVFRGPGWDEHTRRPASRTQGYRKARVGAI
jgi:hypothetical protein